MGLRFDGRYDEKYSPRAIQQYFLDEIKKAYADYDIIICQASTGTGKSSLTRALQRAAYTYVFEEGQRQTREAAVIIHPNNILINQLKGDYPDINVLYGSDNYECHDPDKEYSSCGAKKTGQGESFKPCPNCPRAKAMSGFMKKTLPTVTNVQTYTMMKQFLPQGSFPSYKLNLIDEADSCIRFLESLTGVQISENIAEIDENFDNTVDSAFAHLEKVKETYKNMFLVENSADEKLKLEGKLEKIELIENLLKDYPERYAVFVEKNKSGTRVFCVRPVILPTTAVKSLLGNKAILLSATIFPSQLREILGNKVKIKVIKADSPFEDWRQQVVYKRFPGGMKYDTDVKPICEKIAKDMGELGPDGLKTNTLVHVAYSQTEEYLKHLRALGVPAVSHDSKNKKLVFQEWKKNGGVLVGAGMAEGIDLKDELVRLQFIPRIVKGTGEVLNKRRSLPNGWNMDNLRIWGQIMQTNGRGCRNEKDFCITVCYDAYLLQLYNTMKKNPDAPDWFFRCISVGGRVHKDTPKDYKELFRK